MSKKKNLTNYFIAFLLLSFTFYLYNANSSTFFEPRKDERIEIFKKYNKLNEKNNKNALIKGTKKEKLHYVVSDADGVYLEVNQMPRYASCEYLNEANAQICTKQNINHFKNEIEESLSVYDSVKDWTILLSFVVNEYGYVKSVTAISSGFEEFTDIAMEELKKMPKFAKPGYFGNEAVKVKYIVQLKKIKK